MDHNRFSIGSMIVIVIGVAVCLGFQSREGGCDELSEVGHDPLRHLNPQKPAPPTFQTADLGYIFGNGPFILDGKPFSLNFSEFLHGDAVQEHHNDELLALEKQFSVAESTVQNSKTLTVEQSLRRLL